MRSGSLSSNGTYMNNCRFPRRSSCYSNHVQEIMLRKTTNNYQSFPSVTIRHNAILFLLCTFVFFPSSNANQHSDDVSALQPSKTLLPNLKNFDEDIELLEPGARDRSCWFEARSGRLFNQSVMEIIKQLHPVILRNGGKINVSLNLS